MTKPSSRASAALINWLFAPLALAATGLGVATVLRGPGWIAVGAVALLVGGTFVWILVSVFWPSRADKTCPACGRDALVRLDESTTRGVVCTDCGHTDEATSSFYLAEEDDRPMEPMVLGTRRERRAERRPGRPRRTTGAAR